MFLSVCLSVSLSVCVSVYVCLRKPGVVEALSTVSQDRHLQEFTEVPTQVLLAAVHDIGRSVTRYECHAADTITALNLLKPSVIRWLYFKCSAPYRPNLAFLISDIRALWCSGLSARVPECQKLKTSVRPVWQGVVI